MKAPIALAALLVAALTGFAHASKPAKASVEVAFVLDTTGSMGGLLEAAKARIWSVANEIAKGKPAPDIKMALVAYRDKSDEYVTKRFDLTSNLDAVYKELLALQAGGGGDGPEHVLKGLEESIDRLSWSADARTFKVVYLVGDAPAHQDYDDTPKLAALIERAVRKGLVVNTIQCGSDATTTAQWREIAKLGEGRFLPIPHDGGVVAVETPFDGRLAELSSKLDSTMIAYGARRKEASERKSLMSFISGAAAAPAAADRASYMAKRGFDSEMDLAQAAAEGSVDLKKLDDEALPEEFKKLTPQQREDKIKEVNAQREKMKQEIADLGLKRQEFLKKASPAKDAGFDKGLVDALKAQAAAKGISY